MRERCGTLKDWWYVACTAEELPGGAVIARTIIEERLVLYRDGAGQPVAFIDRCLHRNAELSGGQVEKGCLVCPYHGWTYGSEGQVVRIPSEGAGPPAASGPGSDTSAACATGSAGAGAVRKKIERFPTREQDGLVWVFMGSGDPAALGREPFRFPFHGDPAFASYYMVTRFDGGVTDCAENFMDVPHTVTVHAGWFRSVAKKRVHATVERTRSSVHVTYHMDRDDIGFSRYLFNPRGEETTHTDQFFMPNVTRVDYRFGSRRWFIITSQCTPVTPVETLVYTAITYTLGMGRWFDRVIVPALRWYTRRVIQQDVDIMENQTRSLRRYGKSFLNAEADLHHLYLESLRDWAERGERGPAPEPTRGEMVFYI
jgi:phenylpropionate dioxygenase-like ring-hydroxylating dioxygenase large terminal subunit